jgi:threonine dehydrogenase-like Zn-dependent dehydrogenase
LRVKQSILVQPQTSRLQDRPLPPVGPEDVLVRVQICGVCASELHGWQGDQERYPREYGHEVAGVVVEVGPEVKEFAPGSVVTGLFLRGYAEFACANQRNVLRVPAGMAVEQALGEPLACVMSGARRTRLELGDAVAVVGLGFMGLLALQVLRLRGPAHLIAIDPRPETLAMARQFGADETFTPGEVPEMRKLTRWGQRGEGRGVDVAVEASGTQAGLTLAGELLHEHGFLSVVGYHQGPPRQVDMELWNWKALDVLNAHERRQDYLMDCMRRGLALAASGRLDLRSLVTHSFALEDVDGAFHALQTKPAGFLKAVIRVD